MVRLGDAAKIYRGASPRPIDRFITHNSDGVNWIKIGDVKEGAKYIERASEKITKAGAEKSRAVRAGDFVISNSMSFGRPYILKIDGCVHDGWLVLTEIRADVDRDYLYYVLSSEQSQNQFTNKAAGAVVKNLNVDRVSEVTIPLLPLVLQQSVTRHLSRHDSIQASRAGRIREASQALNATLSAISWHRRMADFCTLAGERVDPGDAPDTDFNYVGLEHIAEGTGESTWSGPCKGATIKSTKNVFRKGDVLYGKLRPYLNKVWIAEFDGVCTTEMLVLKPSIPATLLKYILLHPAFVEQAKAKMGGISLPRIKPAEVMAISVPDVDPQADKLAQMASDIEAKKLRQKGKLDRLRAAKSAYLDKWLG